MATNVQTDDLPSFAERISNKFKLRHARRLVDFAERLS